MEENNVKNEFVKKVAEQKYEFGFTTDVHTEIIDKGLNEDVVRLISRKKGRTGMDARLSSQGLQLLDNLEATIVGTCPRSRNRLSGHILLCRPVGEEACQQERDRPGTGRRLSTNWAFLLKSA
jgi:hypothetical protein